MSKISQCFLVIWQRKDGKGFESFDDGDGVPNRRYFGILNSTNRDDINQAYARVQTLQKSNLPEITNPEAFQAWQKSVDEITDERDFPKLKLGTVDPSGKIVLNPDPRVIATALELQRNGQLTKPDELEVAKKAEQLARTRRERAEAALKEKEVREGKTPAALTPQEQADQHNSQLTVSRVKQVYNTGNYPGTGTPLIKKVDGKDQIITISGVNIAASLKDKGLDPADWGVFTTPASTDVADLSGVERKTVNAKTGEEKKTGDTEQFNKVFALKNKSTGEIRLAYFKEGEKNGKPTGKYAMQALISGREAVGNAARHKHQYKTENSELAKEINRNENMWDGGDAAAVSTKPAPAAATSQFKVNGTPITIEDVRQQNGKKQVKVGNVWKNIKQVDQQGNIITE